MRFRWLRCPRHSWLQVSVLVVGDSTPVCYCPDGSSHPVQLSELERAA